MDIFVEYLDGDYAVCRLPDKAGNLIRVPLKELPEGTAPLKVMVSVAEVEKLAGGDGSGRIQR